MMSEKEGMRKAVEAGVQKVTELKRQPARYFLRAVMAGLYLSLVGFVFWSLLAALQSSPFGRVFASLFFGVGLTVITFTQSELFTSNCFYLASSSLARRTTWRQAIALWSTCWLANLVGALCLALALRAAGVLAALPSDHVLFSGALHKAQQPVAALFWKGVLANWVVCLAAWVALRLEEELAKVATLILVVFVFLYLGFEHSIANMGTFSFSLLGAGTLTLGESLRNLTWSTLGNLLGGGLLVGAVHVYLGGEFAIGLSGEHAESPQMGTRGHSIETTRHACR